MSTKVFQIVTEHSLDDNPEIIKTVSYWTAPSLFAATAAASAHCYEFEQQLMSVQEIITITRNIDFKEGQELLERSIKYGLLHGDAPPDES